MKDFKHKFRGDWGTLKTGISFRTIPDNYEVIIQPKSTDSDTGGSTGVAEHIEEEPIEEDEKVAYGRATAREIVDGQKYFVKRIQSILKDNQIDRMTKNHTSGDLHFKSLYKIKTTSKVFARKGIHSKKKYSLCILLDCSGSMCGTKQNIAVSSAIALSNTLSKVADVQIIGFHAYTVVLKDFHEKLDEAKLIKTVDTMISSPASQGNHDGEAVRIGKRHLSKQDGSKVLLVLSDGLPECGAICSYEGHFGTKDEFRKDLVEEVLSTERQGIAVLGIGIKASYMKEFYKNVRVINHLDQLFKSTLELFNTVVRRIAIR